MPIKYASWKKESEEFLSLLERPCPITYICCFLTLRLNISNFSYLQMNNQKEQISQLQSQLDNLTNAMADMAARMGRLNKEVVERHVIGLCIELIAILLLFVVFVRRRNTQERSSTLQRSGYYMNGHGPPTLAIEDSNHNKNKEIDPTSRFCCKEVKTFDAFEFLL